MIFVYSKKIGDQICIVTDTEPILVNIDSGHCRVEGCGNEVQYGYNFCKEHEWILPICAGKLVHGFQVALIDYWRKQGKKVIQSHSYDMEVLIR